MFESQTIPPRKCDGFIIEDVDGVVVLRHPGRNIVIHSNKTAALVWQLCDGVNTTERIIEILSSAFPDARSQITKDVPEIIQRLRVQRALDGG